ncbi:major facilitator superfamily domain-containing protein [Coniella lustricola]|uniref:Major facilitator superfamily domain-containing protein n=1 Tax=Coniella lustricola TaxID=2025994 RepID=A0A2T3A7U8_9PEZI|nr:major facilitator superfamily domain-containing protein [Coniella lustricola]
MSYTEQIHTSPATVLELQYAPQGAIRNSDTQELDRGANAQELKPVDRGRDAWVVLIAAVVFEAMFWGFPMCFGVFQDYYSALPAFRTDASRVALIGTVAQGTTYLGAPISALVTKKYPHYRQWQIRFGWPLCILGLLAASFASTVPVLIATQGFLYGFGFVTLTYPIISMLNEWWVARKGMAFGLISASSGLTGTFMPFVMDTMLQRFGYTTTLRACAIALLVLTAPLLPLLKARLPVSDNSSARQLARTDWSFLRKGLFWVYAGAVLVQGLGFFFPIVFITSYASAVGISSTLAAALLALMSAAQVLGQFAFGYLSDRSSSGSGGSGAGRRSLGVGVLAGLCCMVAGGAALGLWGAVGTSMAALSVFSLVYGFFGFGFGTMRVAMGRAVGNDDPSALFALYAIFVFLQGVGNIFTGPLSAVLLGEGDQTGVDKDEYGVGRYKDVVIVTGGTSLLAALIIGSWHGYQNLVKMASR